MWIRFKNISPIAYNETHWLGSFISVDATKGYYFYYDLPFWAYIIKKLVLFINLCANKDRNSVYLSLI